MASKAYDLGFANTGFIIYLLGRVGSCALSVLIYNNKIFAANSGDCKGVNNAYFSIKNFNLW